MGKFSHLVDKVSETVEIDGVEYGVKPLMSEDLDLFMGMEQSNAEEQKKAMQYLVLKTLQRVDSEITFEDVQELPMEYTQTVIDAVLRVNGLDKLNA